MFGYIDTTYVDLPAGLDEGYLRGLETRSGLSVAQMITEVDSAMGTINEGANPLVADLVGFTSDPVGPVRGTSTKRVMRAGEYVMGRPQTSSRSGHMLPIAKFEMVIGFTEDGLEDISLQSFRQELEDMVAGFERFYLAETLTRMFSSGEVQVDAGTAVLSPGFAGSGTGSNVFEGVYPDGSPVPGSYTHYAYSTVANLQTTIDTYVGRLKRWHSAPFDMIASPSMMADIAALSGFVSAGSALVRPAQGDAEALVDASNYIGVLDGQIRVRHAVDGIGSGKHAAIFKSYGSFDSRNPLSWRYDPLKGRDAFVRSRHLYPLADATALQWVGVGVGDRASAVLLFVDTAPSAYEDPTITIV
jgi:hypothetical protein